MTDSGPARYSSTTESPSSQNSHKKKRLREFPASVDPVVNGSGNNCSIRNCSPVKSEGITYSKSSSSISGGSPKDSSANSGKYFDKTRSLNQFLSDGSIGRSKSSTSKCVSTRSSEASCLDIFHMTKGYSKSSSSSNIGTSSSSHSTTPDRSTFDRAKVKFLQGLLRTNVQHYRSTDFKDEDIKAFKLYTIHESKLVGKPHSCRCLHEATCRRDKDLPLVCKQYDVHLVHNSFFKMLRYLGRKHPLIIMTLDAFLLDKTIFLFQEMAAHGNLIDYMTANGGGPLSEGTTRRGGMMLASALDFLGNMAICHGSIRPRHLLVSHVGEHFTVKLTGFRASLIYYDIQRDDIHYQPCRQLHLRHKEPEFKAPETYGDPAVEVYDPVSADVWSYGAVLFYMLSGGKYSYEFSKGWRVNIEEEIQQSIGKLKVSKACHNLLSQTLTTATLSRMYVSEMKTHPWLAEHMDSASSGN